MFFFVLKDKSAHLFSRVCFFLTKNKQQHKLLPPVFLVLFILLMYVITPSDASSSSNSSRPLPWESLPRGLENTPGMVQRDDVYLFMETPLRIFSHDEGENEDYRFGVISYCQLSGDGKWYAWTTAQIFERSFNPTAPKKEDDNVVGKSATWFEWTLPREELKNYQQGRDGINEQQRFGTVVAKNGPLVLIEVDNAMIQTSFFQTAGHWTKIASQREVEKVFRPKKEAAQKDETM